MLERFVSINVNGKNSYGIETEEGTINLSDHFPEWPTLLEVVQNKGFDKLLGSLKNGRVSYPKGTYKYNIPISKPEKIICVGVNYPDRNEEYKDGQNTPSNMSLFVRFARSFAIAAFVLSLVAFSINGRSLFL